MNGKIVKARKEHQCSCCFGTILAGTKYYSETLTPWDHQDNDSFTKIKAHTKCHDIFQDIVDDRPYDDFYYPNAPNEWLELLLEEDLITEDNYRERLDELKKRRRTLTNEERN